MAKANSDTPNLTQTNKVAREVSLDPLPGHTLVVYKCVGDRGKTFFVELSPEQQFKEERTRWWKRFTSDPPSYIAYAVNLNESLKHVISRRVSLLNQEHAFDLIVTLWFHVTTPRRVADRYEDDPLGLLEDAIVDHVKEVVAVREWDDIKYRFTLAAEDVILATRGLIDRTAESIGFAVESIRLERQLLQKDLEVEELRGKLEVSQKKGEMQHEDALIRARLKHEQDAAKLDYEGQLVHQKLKQAESRMETENHLKHNERLNKLQDGVVEGGIVAVQGTAAEMKTPGQIEAGFRVFQRITRGQAADGGAGGSGSGTASALDGTQDYIKALPEYGGGPLTKVFDLLVRTVRAVEEAGLTNVEKTRLLSVLFHVAAEAMLGDEADDDRLQGYNERLTVVASDLSHYTPELERFLRDNYRALKERWK